MKTNEEPNPLPAKSGENLAFWGAKKKQQQTCALPARVMDVTDRGAPTTLQRGPSDAVVMLGGPGLVHPCSDAGGSPTDAALGSGLL